MDFSNNHLKDISVAICKAQSLKTLKISNNFFETIPSTYYLLPNLEEIELDWF